MEKINRIQHNDDSGPHLEEMSLLVLVPGHTECDVETRLNEICGY
jgi:hypothetical protein